MLGGFTTSGITYDPAPRPRTQWARSPPDTTAYTRWHRRQAYLHPDTSRLRPLVERLPPPGRKMHFGPRRVPNFGSPHSPNGTRQQPVIVTLPTLGIGQPLHPLQSHPLIGAVDMAPAMMNGRPVNMPGDYAMKLEQWRNGGWEHYRMKLDEIGRKKEGMPAAEMVPDGEGPDGIPPMHDIFNLGSPGAAVDLPPLEGHPPEKRKTGHKEHKHKHKGHKPAEPKKAESKHKPGAQKTGSGMVGIFRVKPKQKEPNRHRKKGSKESNHVEDEAAGEEAAKEATPEPPNAPSPEEAPSSPPAPSMTHKLVKKVSFLIEKKDKKSKKDGKLVLVMPKKDHGRKKEEKKGSKKTKAKEKSKGGKKKEKKAEEFDATGSELPDPPGEMESQEEHPGIDPYEHNAENVSPEDMQEHEAPAGQPPEEGMEEHGAHGDEVPPPPPSPPEDAHVQHAEEPAHGDSAEPAGTHTEGHDSEPLAQHEGGNVTSEPHEQPAAAERTVHGTDAEEHDAGIEHANPAEGSPHKDPYASYRGTCA